MSMAWEVTEDDVRTVLAAHGVILSDDEVCEAHDGIDMDAVEEAVLAYTDFDDQCNAAMCEIEDQLMAEDIIVGDKQFTGA